MESTALCFVSPWDLRWVEDGRQVQTLQSSARQQSGIQQDSSHYQKVYSALRRCPCHHSSATVPTSLSPLGTKIFLKPGIFVTHVSPVAIMRLIIFPFLIQ